MPNYDKLAEAAGNLNAVAGGSADTFKSVAMVLTQTAGQGKLTTENWNQLSDAIPGASGKIQQALKEAGAYTGNFRDAMADGRSPRRNSTTRSCRSASPTPPWKPPHPPAPSREPPATSKPRSSSSARACSTASNPPSPAA